MRKLTYLALAGAALGTASMANAAATVTSSTGLNNPVPVAVFNPLTNTTSIDFGTNPITSNPYSASFMFNTTTPYSGNFTSSTSTSGGTFTAASLTGTGLSSSGALFSGIGTNFIQSFGVPLAAGGNYVFSVTLANATAFTGNGTLSPAAVPEAATWAMMLVGFGGMGLVLRRKRRPVLAQIA